MSELQNLSPATLASHYADKTDKCIIITGKAGTGKTTFLRQLTSNSKKNIAVTAPTAVAAINAGGVTIHSFFQLPARTIYPSKSSYQQLFAEQRMRQRKRNLLNQLELLVIDEISMVRADIVDAIDMVLRHYKHRPQVPFGGVQVIMIGDLMQLPPVVHSSEDEKLDEYYAGPYFFQSKVMQEIKPVYIEFNHIYRQQDLKFINLLNEVRDNHLSEVSKSILEARYVPNFINDEDNFHITLTTHNNKADELNKRKLDEIKEEVHCFEAEINNNFPENSYPTDATLCLKKEARVMFIKNDEQGAKRFYNGKIGKVCEIDADKIVVECDKEKIDVPQVEWKNIRYVEDAKTGRLVEEVLGTFKQYPLRLAWAITIHKSQGLTFDKVIIDAAQSFAAGQVYVALSRCRTLEGLVLSSPLHKINLRGNYQVLNYLENQPSIEEANGQLVQAEQDYILKIFLNLFSFENISIIIDQMRRYIAKCVSFNNESDFFLVNLLSRVKEQEQVILSFQRQLTGLITSNQKQKLQERIKAASGYFLPILKDFMEAMLVHPCRCKNSTDASDFDPLLEELYLTIYQKMKLMRAVAIDATIYTYFNAKINIDKPEEYIKSSFEKFSISKKKEKATKRTSTPKKEPTPDTYEMTYDLFKSGKTPEEIAEQRGLTIETIFRHLTRYVLRGQILLPNVVPASTIDRILRLWADNAEHRKLGELMTIAKGEFPYYYLKLVLTASKLIENEN